MGVSKERLRAVQRMTRKAQRYKRTMRVARLAGVVTGWLLAYILFGLAVFLVASFAWSLLTGQAPNSWGEAIGLMVLVFLGLGISELLRARPGRK